jgi:hypothetical protein
MIIKLLGQEVEFNDELHALALVERGLFIASIHWYDKFPTSKSEFTYYWVLEARTLEPRVKYGQGRTNSLEDAVARVNGLAEKLSREQRELFSRVREVP